jgi:hypothetical protein
MRTIRAILNFLRAVRIPKQVEWTQEDTGAIRLFLGTTTGAKVRNLLLGNIVSYNEYAANKADPKTCGEAVGFKTAYSYLISLAGAQSSKSEQPADTNGMAGPLDHLRP